MKKRPVREPNEGRAHTQAEVAKKLGVSRGRVSHIEKKAMAKLRRSATTTRHRKFWDSVRSWIETADVIMEERRR